MAHEALRRRRRQRARAGPRAAIGAWLGGDWGGAARRLDDLLVRWPSDVLALMFGHQLDFFIGDAQALRDRPIRSLRAIDPEHPHAPFVRGMAAFGLEESGHYGEALAAGLAAVEANPDDVWAHPRRRPHLRDAGPRRRGHRLPALRPHAVGGRQPVHGAQLVAPRRCTSWRPGVPERSLAIYDAEIHHAGSLGVPIEMLDASALLWRLLLDGIDTGGRFGPLADAWAPKAAAEPWYVFNDLHATMAFAGAGRLGDGPRADRPPRPLARLGERLERPHDGRDRPAGVPRRRRLRRGPPRRRRRRAVPDPARARPLRRLARPARRAAAHAARVGAARRPLRAGRRASRPSASASASPACTAGASGPAPCAASATTAGAPSAATARAADAAAAASGSPADPIASRSRPPPSTRPSRLARDPYSDADHLAAPEPNAHRPGGDPHDHDPDPCPTPDRRRAARRHRRPGPRWSRTPSGSPASSPTARSPTTVTPRSPPSTSTACATRASSYAPDPERARRRRRRLDPRRARRDVAPRPRRRVDVDRRQHALRRAAQRRAAVAHRRRPWRRRARPTALRGDAADGRPPADVVFATAVSEPAPQDLTRPATTRRAGRGRLADRRPQGVRHDGAGGHRRSTSPSRTSTTTATERYGFALVPTTAPGVEFAHDWDALGMRASESGSVTFHDVCVGARRRARRVRRRRVLGVALLDRFLVSGAFHAAASLGIAESAHARIVDVAARQGRRHARRPARRDAPGRERRRPGHACAPCSTGPVG